MVVMLVMAPVKAHVPLACFAMLMGPAEVNCYFRNVNINDQGPIILENMYAFFDIKMELIKIKNSFPEEATNATDTGNS